MKLKQWLNTKRGRTTALAIELKVSLARISQMTDDGVPDKYKLAVRDFTRGAVSLESMIKERTPPATSMNVDSITTNILKSTRGALSAQCIDDNKNQNIKVSG